MNTFYTLLITCLVLLLSACGGDKEQPPMAVKKETEPQKSTPVLPKTKKKVAKTYPKLHQKNFEKYILEYGKNTTSDVVEISSSFGNIKIRLYKNTPLHRANFLYLTERKYFDLTQFYRVSKNFVCQAGNSDETEAQDFRTKIGHYSIPNEMDNENCHKYGAVAMARVYENNPDKVSSAFEWYIVLGEKYNRATLRALERENEITYTEQQKEYYTQLGGAPFLDQQHTVFGEVIEGMDVVKKINAVNVDSREWPLTNIPIKARIVK